MNQKLLNPKLWAVVPAAGSGKRFSATELKQYQRIDQYTILEHSIWALTQLPLAGCVIVISAEDQFFPQLKLPAVVQSCFGGQERMDSVFAGLLHLENQAAADDYVLVHDAARPCLHPEQIQKILEFCQTGQDAAILAVPVRDTLKKATNEHTIEKTIDREQIWQAQTPQIVKYSILKAALSNAITDKAIVTDEASALERLGVEVHLIAGRMDNIKITYPEDLDLARLILAR